MNRRKLLGYSAAALAAGGLLPLIGRWQRASGDAQGQRLAMPPLLDTRASGRLALAAQAGESHFIGAAATRTVGFNQAYLGPTIVMQNGALATRVANRLQETVTAHWHGMLVPGHLDGSGHSPIEPGRTWDIELQVKQQPAMLWYHSHTHGATARHVYWGLAGAIHLTDGRDDQRGLPSRYGVDDLTLVLQDRRFDDAGRMVYDPDPTDILNGFHGGRMLVNGQWNAVAAVPRGVVRLRLLNGSNARVYSLHFSDGRPMHLIATDGGFLPKPVEITYLRLAPGERMEVLVDFAAGPPPVMMSARGLPMRILGFEIDERAGARITRLPDNLDAVAAFEPPGDIHVRRFNLTMGGSSQGQTTLASAGTGQHAGHGGHAGHAGHGGLIGAGIDGKLGGTAMTDFAINGRPHDMRRIDFEVGRGSYERWFINGGAGVDHPFHVHGVHFRVASVGGAEPPPESSGWKDTVLVTGETEIVVRFDHLAPRDAPYMFHCHILEHEDAGMMGQFTVS